MEKDFITYSHFDPEVLAAISNVNKLSRVYEACEDPWVKRIFERLVRDAIKHEDEVELKSRVREAVEMLHNLQSPKINLN